MHAGCPGDAERRVPGGLRKLQTLPEYMQTGDFTIHESPSDDRKAIQRLTKMCGSPMSHEHQYTPALIAKRSKRVQGRRGLGGA